MNLDKLVLEAAGSLSGESSKTFNIYDYENSRQASIENRIEAKKIKEIERQQQEAKKNDNKLQYIKLGKILDDVKELKKKLAKADLKEKALIKQEIKNKLSIGETEETKAMEKKLEATDLGANNIEKNRGTNNVETIKKIFNTKKKLYNLMMNYVNLVSGVGLEGDFEKKNATRIVKDAEGNKKVVGVPSDATLNAHYKLLKDSAEQLAKYESKAPIRYFDEHQDRAKDLLKAVSRVAPTELSFDPEDVSVPVKTNAHLVKTGSFIERDGKRTEEKYAEIEPVERDHSGKIVTPISKQKGVVPIGVERFNAFVLEELHPFIDEFKIYNGIKAENFKDFILNNISTGSRGETFKIFKKKMISDFLANDVKEGLKIRKKNMSKALKSDNEQDYEKARENERKIGNFTRAKDLSRKEDGTIDNPTYGSKLGAGKNALRSALYAKDKTDTTESKTGNQGWLEAHHIEKINITKVRKIIDGWIEKGEKPSSENKKIIKFYGSMPGTDGQGGAGTLIFMPTSNPVEGQFSIDGLYAFKAGKKFLNGDLTLEQEKYVENHAGKKGADEWKKKVLEELKKYDIEGQSTVQTEEVIYFNY